MGCTNRPGHPGNFIQGSYTPNSKKELEEYKKLHYNRYHARIITPDGLGASSVKHIKIFLKPSEDILETLAKIQNKSEDGRNQ